MSFIENRIRAGTLPLAPQWYLVKIPRFFHGAVNVLSKRWRPGDLGKSMRPLQNVDAQSDPMQMLNLNEESSKQIQRLTFKMLSMNSQLILNAAFMSWETVIGLGRDVPSHPAFIIISKWLSLTILWGRLFSAHHLAIWALKFLK